MLRKCIGKLNIHDFIHFFKMEREDSCSFLALFFLCMIIDFDIPNFNRSGLFYHMCGIDDRP